MKKILQKLVVVLLLLFVALAIFFFWASAPTLNEKDYESLIVNDYETTISNDSVHSIIAYNIGYLSGMTNNLPVAKPKELFDKNLQIVMAQVKKEQPDIIAFQEIDYDANRSYHINQEAEIAKLGYNYVAHAVNWDETYVPFPYWPPSMHFGKVVSGQSIISKYPLKNHKRDVLERVASNPFYRDALYLERLLQIATVTIKGREVVLMNVHLEAFDKATRVKQFNYVLQLFNEFRKDTPTILLGDFNSAAQEKDAIIQKMFAQTNVGNAAFDKNNIVNTSDSRNPLKRIDYIFYSSNTIEYISGSVLKSFGEASDHLPVEMKFKLK